MSKFRLRGKEALCITLMLKTGRPVMIVVVPANAGTHNHRRLLLRKATGRVLKDNAAAYGSLLSQGRRDDVEIEELAYFLAGAILLSAGLAGSVLVAAAAGWSMRSTFAASRSFAT
jgi:hypothetical protein